MVFLQGKGNLIRIVWFDKEEKSLSLEYASQKFTIPVYPWGKLLYEVHVSECTSCP